MWENISGPGINDGNTVCISARLSVPGGWLVRTVVSRCNGGACVVHTFVPDENHLWDMTEKAIAQA